MTRLFPTGSAVPLRPVAAPDDPITVLPAKLAPPDLAHATMLRPRLLGLLGRAVHRSPLTLLSGPAGSGKTVLAATWRDTEGAGKAVAWLSLDDYDDDPGAFWNYVVEALRSTGVQLSASARFVPGEAPPTRSLTALAAELGSRQRPVVLIIDNADHVTDKAITAGLDLLIRTAASRLRLVLCARADPQLPLHQYRLAGTISEIRSDQLAFTPSETRDLLTLMEVPVTAEIADGLCTETRGWAVGLRLAAAPLKQGLPPERLVTSLAHDDGSVAQYLFAEVLAGQPPAVCELLLRTSVTAELWPDLVDRLSGRSDSRRVLSALARANAFVEESSGEPGGFRIHPLFREMLQAQLRYDHPGEVAGLHRICAEWFAHAGRTTEAIEHATAAEDWAVAARLLIDDLLIARLLAHGSDPVLRGLGALPDDLVAPEAAVIRAATALAAGHDPVPADLVTAAAAADGGSRPALCASAALTCLTASLVAGGVPAQSLVWLEAAQTALATLPGEDRRERREYVAVLASARALITLCDAAPSRQVVTELRAAAATGRAAGSRWLRCRALAHLALLEALDGRLTRAAQLAGEAETLSADGGTEEPDRVAAAATAEAWVHLQRYALVEAREWMGRAVIRHRQRPAAPEADLIGALLAVLQARLLRLRREYDSADECLSRWLADAGLPRWVAQRLTVEAVRLAFARGHVTDGLRLLEEREVDAGERPRLQTWATLLLGTGSALAPAVEEPDAAPADVVESRVLRACQLLETAAVSTAAEELERGLELARTETLRLPFIDAPAQARRLLRTHPRLQVPAAWLSPSASVSAVTAAPAIPRPRAAETVPLIQDLSERETEVLQHLAEMLSTAEIAASMFISVNTVRTHIRSILRKLGVSRRNQAVRRARDTGLL